MVVSFKIFVNYFPKNKAVNNFRNYKSPDAVDFSNHLPTNYEQLLFSNCNHLPNISPMCVNCKTNFYRNDASSYVDLKAPLLCKEITGKETGGVSYNSEIPEAKKKLLEKRKNCIICMKMIIIKPDFV